MKQKIITIFIVLLLLAAISAFICLFVFIYNNAPHELEYSAQGVLWRNNDPEYEEPITIELSGKISKKEFNGEITFISDSFNETYDSVNILFDSGGVGYARNYIDFPLDSQTIGNMKFDKKTGTCCFLLWEDPGHWEGETSLIISAPAATREEAVNVTREIFKNSTWWLSEAEWN